MNPDDKVTVTLTRAELEDVHNIMDWEVSYDEGAEPEDRDARAIIVSKLYNALKENA